MKPTIPLFHGTPDLLIKLTYRPKMYESSALPRFVIPEVFLTGNLKVVAEDVVYSTI